jgi:UDP-N-acetylmuramate--alanine ligase
LTERLGIVEVSLPGRHNLQNAMATIAVASQIGLPFDDIAAALKTFEAPERRFERHGEVGGVLVVDDYAHHPTEIAAVLAAARSALDRRLIVAFQPHRYSRTAQLMDEFGRALQQADEIILTDIYPASEEPIAGITIDALADAIRRASPDRPVRIARGLDEVVPELLKVARAGDAVITLGAGSIGTLPRHLIDALKLREANA